MLKIYLDKEHTKYESKLKEFLEELFDNNCNFSSAEYQIFTSIDMEEK